MPPEEQSMGSYALWLWQLLHRLAHNKAELVRLRPRRWNRGCELALRLVHEQHFLASACERLAGELALGAEVVAVLTALQA